MPREKIVKIYKYDELSKKAKKRAVSDWTSSGNEFDSHDGELLSESFREILMEHGFEEGVKVNWSLNSCQGDGVCFSGHVDPEKFAKEDGQSKWKALAPHVGIIVTTSHDSRYCHWNSMSVEIERTVSHFLDLIPKKLYMEIEDWEVAQGRIERDYDRNVITVLAARQQPILDWERETAKYNIRPGVLEWMPDIPVKPEPLDIPLPPKPDLEDEPEEFILAKKDAEEEFVKMEAKLDGLEEDVKGWVEDLSRELEKIGYEEIEYRSSEEAVRETFEANDFEFYEDGERVR